MTPTDESRPGRELFYILLGWLPSVKKENKRLWKVADAWQEECQKPAPKFPHDHFGG